jgi:transposase
MGLLNQMEGEAKGGGIRHLLPNAMFLDRLRSRTSGHSCSPRWRRRRAAPFPSAWRRRRKKKARNLTPQPRRRETLERKALSDPAVLETLRVFEGAMLVKVNRAPAGRAAFRRRVPRREWRGTRRSHADAEGSEDASGEDAPDD